MAALTENYKKHAKAAKHFIKTDFFFSCKVQRGLFSE